MKKQAITVIALSALVLGGCSGGDESSDPGTGSATLPQCSSNTYVSFDSGNHANQEVRLQTHASLGSLMKEAAALHADGNTSGAAQKFSEAKALYTDPVASAKLQEKVQGRLDEHLAGAPSQGDRLDGTIIAWLDKGAAATNELEATIARQWVDKTLTEFFFLSVHHEILAGTKKNWDEGFGYYGSGVDNAESNLLGLAQTAHKRDATNGTNLEAEIYNGLIDGSCEIGTELQASGADALELSSVPALKALVDDIDMNMQLVLAYSAGHEAFEMAEVLEASPRDDAELFIKAAELIPFFLPLERIMLERGGESAERAKQIRGYLDAMPVSDPATLDVTDTTWIDALGDAPQNIINALEAEYGIDIKG